MADFTRFISYLYDYRVGERNRNLGFFKVESRQGMCRLTVSLNHGQVLQQNMSLCGYITEDGRAELVRLGEMEKGSRERQWRFPADNLGGLGFGLERLAGLILLSGDRRAFLLSVWNDGLLTAEDIRQGTFLEKAQTRGAIEAGRRETVESGSREEIEYRSRQAIEPANQGDTVLSAAAEKTIAEEETAAEKASEKVTGKLAGEEMRSDTEEDGPELWKMPVTANKESKQEPDDHTRYQVDRDNDAIAMEKAISAPDSWHALCKLFPAARPFEPSVWEVLCISLQDIGRLPPENWVWGNNHFLLHGFYQYHHLILARQRVENRIYLGIPGEFGVNEKFMAAMFGLHQFQRERKGRSDKGYWLTPIRL